MLILVFDTETTGLPKYKELSIKTIKLWPHIVQFSYVLYDSDENKLTKMRDWIIKLPKNIEISKESTEIHGITNEISQKNGYNIQEIMPEIFRDFNQADQIVGHNLNFDLNMLKCEILRILINHKNNPVILNEFDEYHQILNSTKKFYCTMQETIEYCNIISVDRNGMEFQKYPRLSELYQKMFKENPKNLHNSLNDVVVCLRCFMKWKHNIDILTSNKEIESFISSRL
jgi:DNA polymerase III epsilon subunit-like protein